MAQDTEIIELKFEGNGIKPSKVKASEVAELIFSYEKAIVSLIKHTYPEISDDFVLLSFEDVQNKSLSLKCLAHEAKKYVIPAYRTIATCISTNNYNSLPYDSIDGIRGLTRFSRKHDCDGNFILDNQRIATFNSDSKVAYSDDGIIKGDTTIYGEVKKAGGENPRVTLKINNAYSLSFDVKKEIAAELGRKLYTEVGLSGLAKWDKRTYKVLDFTPQTIITLTPEKLSDSFIGLNKLIGSYLEKENEA